MTTQEVANRLVELCRTGNYEQAHKELYAQDALSVEPEGVPNRTSQGLEALAQKGQKFEEMVETMHKSEVSDPIVAENFFSCSMKMNMTMKGVPQPVDMDELCMFTVKDGKITKEEFFYTPQPPQA